MGKNKSALSKFITLTIKIYQYCLSPFLGNACRFYPSCSNYAIESIQLHGSVKGSFLTLKRIIRCHPWTPGGNDPVPEPHSKC